MKYGIVAAIAAPVAAFAVLITAVVLLFPPPPASAACPSGPGVSVSTGPLPGSVAGYSGGQLMIAATIMKAGKDTGVDVRGQTIGVAVGMGESGLTNVMHGDAAGPDSIGVFQQQANGAWGSLADRTNPYIAATNFFKALLRVPGWESMTPTAAAHAVQGNADPGYYARFWDPAIAVVSALAGVPVNLAAGTGNQTCTASAPGSIPAPGGWVNPVPGAPITSPFGYRPATSVSPPEFHQGVDLGAACGTPIYAVAAGTVISSGPASGFGDWIRIDHGGGVVTIYGHMYPQDLLVRVGDAVKAGQQIAKVGANGQASGCHLHLGVMVAGALVDPLPFMASKGIRL